jgi:hypothetical protein
LAFQQKSRIVHDIPFNPAGKFGKEIGVGARLAAYSMIFARFPNQVWMRCPPYW